MLSDELFSLAYMMFQRQLLSISLALTGESNFVILKLTLAAIAELTGKLAICGTGGHCHSVLSASCRHDECIEVDDLDSGKLASCSATWHATTFPLSFSSWGGSVFADIIFSASRLSSSGGLNISRNCNTVWSRTVGAALYNIILQAGVIIHRADGAPL
ncbi:hypothetical protein BX600DRAFT_512263 [Xylariales sp. PMI_506]|nr:hypothetical protein BX600DRAFT_512263 [Xylariales sp. PMI_506]